jgi:hypothetical protein
MQFSKYNETSPKVKPLQILKPQKEGNFFSEEKKL